MCLENAQHSPPSLNLSSQGSAVGAMPTSASIFEEEKTHFASLASDGTRVTTPSLDHPFTSQTQVKAFSSPSPSDPAQPQNRSTDKGSLVATENSNKFLQSTCSLNPASSRPSHEKPPVNTNLKEKYFSSNSVNKARVDATKPSPDSISKAQEDWGSSMDRRTKQASGNPKYMSRAVPWSSSASLPRGFRRSEGSSHISAAVTARPFGIKQSRMSSVPRLYSVSLWII